MLIYFGTASDAAMLAPGKAETALKAQILAAADCDAAIRFGILHDGEEAPANVDTPASVQVHPVNISDPAADLGLEGATLVVLNCRIPFAYLMKVARAARGAGVCVLFNLATLPDLIAMPELHALLGQTDILMLRQAELHKAVELLGKDMLGDCETTAEKVGALAYWASFAVIATDGREGVIYAERDMPAQRVLSPQGQDMDDPALGNVFIGTVAAGLSAHRRMADSIPQAIDAAGAKATMVQG